MIAQPVATRESGTADLRRWVDLRKTPGLQYLAVNATGIVAELTAGSSDLRGAAPMGETTGMMAYSMTKTITAAAVLQLVERERIALDERVTRYLPESPYGDDVTVRELLTHTGGVPNPIPLRWVHPATAHDGFDEEAAFHAVLRAHPRLSHRPGSRYAYSNIGYWMLGKIVERVSGRPFSSYVTTEIIERLGIPASDLSFTVNDAERHAVGYLEKYSLANLLKGWLFDPALIGGYDGRWLRIASHYPNGPAFGGLVGTARGFARFLQDQLGRGSALFSGATQSAFYTPQRTRTGTAVPMTLGWHIGHSGSDRFYFKEGGGGGFHSMMRLYPTRGVASVVMTNATNFDVAGFLHNVDPLIAPPDVS